MSDSILYTEEGFTGITPVFMPDEEYGRALETFIVPCADTIIIDRKEKTVYLAKRRAKPIHDTWWVIGGRRKPGMSARDAMKDIFKRETSLEISPERFQYIATVEYLLKDRQQPPQEKNLHTQGVTYALELTSEERYVVAANLDPKEYYSELGLKGFPSSEFQELHPVVRTLALKVFS